MLKPRTDLPNDFVIEMEAKSEFRIYVQCARCKGAAEKPVLVGMNMYCAKCAAELAVKAMIV